jgi:hypothetical protein
LDSILVTSTTNALENIEILFKRGELKDALTKKPNNENYLWVGVPDYMSYSDAIAHFVLREDGDILLNKIFELQKDLPQEFLDELLMRSLRYSSKRTIALQMIAAGANINQTDIDECTPLYLAARKGDLEIVEALIAREGI